MFVFPMWMLQESIFDSSTHPPTRYFNLPTNFIRNKLSFLFMTKKTHSLIIIYTVLIKRTSPLIIITSILFCLQDENIGGYIIQQNTNGRPSGIFRFPPKIIIKASCYTTVWIKVLFFLYIKFTFYFHFLLQLFFTPRKSSKTIDLHEFVQKVDPIFIP